MSKTTNQKTKYRPINLICAVLLIGVSQNFIFSKSAYAQASVIDWRALANDIYEFGETKAQWLYENTQSSLKWAWEGTQWLASRAQAQQAALAITTGQRAQLQGQLAIAASAADRQSEETGIAAAVRATAENPRERVPQACNLTLTGGAKAPMKAWVAGKKAEWTLKLATRGLGKEEDYSGPSGTAKRTERASMDIVRDPYFTPGSGGPSNGNYILLLNEFTKMQAVDDISSVTSSSPPSQIAFAKAMLVAEIIAGPRPTFGGKVDSPASSTEADVFRTAMAREGLLLETLAENIAYRACPNPDLSKDAAFVKVLKDACLAAKALGITKAVDDTCECVSLADLDDYDVEKSCTEQSIQQAVQNQAKTEENRKTLQDCGTARLALETKRIAMKAALDNAVANMAVVIAQFPDSGGAMPASSPEAPFAPNNKERSAKAKTHKTEPELARAEQPVSPPAALPQLHPYETYGNGILGAVGLTPASLPVAIEQ